MRNSVLVKIILTCLIVVLASSLAIYLTPERSPNSGDTSRFVADFSLSGEPSGTGFAPGYQVTTAGQLAIAISPEPPIRVGDSAQILVEAVTGELEVPVKLSLSVPSNSSVEFNSTESTFTYDPATGELTGSPIVFEAGSAGTKIFSVRVQEVRRLPIVKAPREAFATLSVEFAEPETSTDYLDLALRIAQALASIIGLPALIMLMIKRRQENDKKLKKSLILPDDPDFKL